MSPHSGTVFLHVAAVCETIILPFMVVLQDESATSKPKHCALLLKDKMCTWADDLVQVLSSVEKANALLGAQRYVILALFCQ